MYLLKIHVLTVIKMINSEFRIRYYLIIKITGRIPSTISQGSHALTATAVTEQILHSINVSRAYRNWTLIFYADKESVKLKAINALYRNITDSWHRFDFKQLDEKAKELLNKLKSIVNRRLTREKKEIKQRGSADR